MHLQIRHFAREIEMMKGVCQVGLVSTRATDLIAFYRDMLGFPVLFSANGMTFLQAGATNLMIGEATDSPTLGNDVTLYFEPEDWATMEAALIARGIVFERDAMVVQRHGDREHVLRPFKDPEGRRLYLLGWRAV
jgi:methylmalonyl-CoA/ethylmalonyl-CoA epimerase